MAFMTPLVKKRYDIYEHAGKSNPEPSFHLKSLKLVSKLYRIVISGKQSSDKSSSKPAAQKRAHVADVPKIQIHTIPSLVVTPPVVTVVPSVPQVPKSVPKVASSPKPNQSHAISIPKPSNAHSPKSSPSGSPRSSSPRSSSPTSSYSCSPPSRPIPHIKRTMRDSVTNRVYSYSVSIPDYVPEENEEDLEAEQEEGAAFTPPSVSSYYCRQLSSSAPHVGQFEFQNSSQLPAPH